MNFVNVSDVFFLFFFIRDLGHYVKFRIGFGLLKIFFFFLFTVIA